MDDKNELNDLLLGNQKESGSSKKFFLIAAGILLLFFIIIGVMKFAGSNDTKQPMPITGQEQPKKPLPPASALPSGSNATTASADANASQDEKLNAIVKKLQQDAEHQANTNAGTASIPVSKAEQKPSTTPQAVPVTVKPVQSQQAVSNATAQKTTAIPIKNVEQPKQTVKPKETAKKEVAKKEDVKTAFKDATKNVVKQKPVAKTEKTASKKSDSNVSSGAYYIQVGYFDSESAAKKTRDKVNSIGLGSATKNAVKGDKNITKVWAGPFGSKDEAQKALPKVREQIKNDAFIIKG
jgi:DedD protein